MVGREKIKLITGVPLVVTLQDPRGKQASSPYTGLEYKFLVLRGGCPATLYLPPEGANALQRCGAQSGEEVQLVRSLGAGGGFDFHINRRSDAYEQQPPQRPPMRLLAPVAPVQRYAQGPHYEEAPPPPPPHQQQQEQPNRMSTGALLGQCLMCAVDAALGSEKFAAAKGKALSFNEEDIRAMAISIYIQKTKEARY